MSPSPLPLTFLPIVGGQLFLSNPLPSHLTAKGETTVKNTAAAPSVEFLYFERNWYRGSTFLSFPPTSSSIPIGTSPTQSILVTSFRPGLALLPRPFLAPAGFASLILFSEQHHVSDGADSGG